VYETWESNYGTGLPCSNCICLNTTEDNPQCEVYEGIEEATECEAWQDFVQYNEIKIY